MGHKNSSANIRIPYIHVYIYIHMCARVIAWGPPACTNLGLSVARKPINNSLKTNGRKVKRKKKIK